jgi:tetratricopeptide (TPR) repeat protein
MALPEDPFWAHALGVLLLGQQRYTEAEGAFREALSRDPHYVATYYQLGLLSEAKGDIEAAIGIFREGEKLAADKRELRLLRDFRAKLTLYLGIDAG